MVNNNFLLFKSFGLIPYNKAIFLFGIFLFGYLSSYGQININITIERLAIKNGLVTGKIYANGSYLGPCYENEVLRIQEGSYNGTMRYYSDNGFVSNPFGKLATEGDFLLEVYNVANRRDLLFHTGNKPYHARGCVLLGAPIVENGVKYLPIEHPIRKLREMFYGTNNPLASPNKKINISFDESKIKKNNDSVNTSLLILIDVSGSMSGDKLNHAKASAKDAVRKALKNKNTEVAVLAFAGDCSNPIHSAIGFSTNEKFLLETINKLEAKGGTPLASALKNANNYMFRNKSFTSITQMIILLADGDDDCGNLSSVLASLNNNEIVFRHETIGLGLGNNIKAQNQLKSIAENTNGEYHNAVSHTDLSTRFDAAMENMRMMEMMGKMNNGNQKTNQEKNKDNNNIKWDILKN